MNILMISPFYPPDFGGISYHVSNIAGLLSKKDRITVVTCGTCRWNDGKHFKDNLEVIRIPSITPPPYPYQTLSSFRIPISINRLQKIIESDKFDILHAHGHHFPITWLAVNIGKAKGMSTVLTAHGMHGLTWHQTLTEEVFNNIVLKTLLTKLDAIIGVTPTVVDYLKKYGPRKGSYYAIPNGVDLQRYRENLHRKIEYRKIYGIPQEKIVILYRGRLVDVKGALEFAYAIDIINRIQKHKDKVYFVICGEGPLKEGISLSLKRADNCKIIGWTSSERVHELYIASDAYVLPSKWEEAFSVTLLEAMAANLYVITTEVGGVPDVLAHYPWKICISDFNPVGIARAIMNFLDTKQATKVEDELTGSVGYLKRFDWNYVVREIENVYVSIARARERKPLKSR